MAHRGATMEKGQPYLSSTTTSYKGLAHSPHPPLSRSSNVNRSVCGGGGGAGSQLETHGKDREQLGPGSSATTTAPHMTG